MAKLNYVWIFLFLFLSACSTDETSEPDDQPLGVSARSFLSDESFTSLTVEVVYVSGYEPATGSLNAIEEFLSEYLNKPEGIRVEPRAIPSPGISVYSLEQVKEIESKYRTAFTSGKNLTVFIYLADGKSEDSGSSSGSSSEYEVVLGKAYRNTSMVIFDKEIRDYAVKYIDVSRQDVLETTIKHEFGHLFGLVDNGTPAQTDHEYSNPNNPKEKGHCIVETCLMARLSSGFSSELTFGEYCHLDLVANGGK